MLIYWYSKNVLHKLEFEQKDVQLVLWPCLGSMAAWQVKCSPLDEN